MSNDREAVGDGSTQLNSLPSCTNSVVHNLVESKNNGNCRVHSKKAPV